jgi:AcrR family transcriptional regulator
MSRFSESEKERIQHLLLQAGEQLFNEKGLKAVTVDDISLAVGIGKGTFYHFYANKEHLYMEINNQIQKQIFSEFSRLLDQKQTASKARFVSLMHNLLEQFMRHPILCQIDGSVYAKFEKKVPKECMAQNDQLDIAMVSKASESGIRFKVPLIQVTKLLQVTFLNASHLMAHGEGEVVRLLFSAICDYIVEED